MTEYFSGGKSIGQTLHPSIKVLIQDNKLLALTIGTTYIQRYNATTNCIYAYKVIVE